MSYRKINIISAQVINGKTKIEIEYNKEFQKVVFMKISVNKKLPLKIDGKKIIEITLAKYAKNTLIIFINSELSLSTGLCQYSV